MTIFIIQWGFFSKIGQALAEAYARVEGYHTFYSWSRLRSGYSGVAIYCKTSLTPIRAEEGRINRLMLAMFHSFSL